MASKFNPYQRRKTPIRDLYTAQRRLTPDEDDPTPSEFEVVNHDGIEDAPSKFEVCDIATAWKDFVTNSPIVGWVATHLVLHNTRSEVYKVLDRLLAGFSTSKPYLKFAQWQSWTKPPKTHMIDTCIRYVRRRRLFVMNKVSRKAQISSSR